MWKISPTFVGLIFISTLYWIHMLHAAAKNLVTAYLTRCAHRYIRRTRPVVVCIMGGKSRALARYELERSLRASGQTRVNLKGYTSTIGVPLAVLGLHAGFSSWGKWWRLIREAKRVAASGAAVRTIILEIAYDTDQRLAALMELLLPRLILVSDPVGGEAEAAIIERLRAHGYQIIGPAVSVADVRESDGVTRYTLIRGDSRTERVLPAFGDDHVRVDALVQTALAMLA